MRMRLVLSALVLLSLSACAAKTAANLGKLYVGADKSFVASNIGNPQAYIGSFNTPNLRLVEVWQYSVLAPADSSLGTAFSDGMVRGMTFGLVNPNDTKPRMVYYFYYINNKLVRFGNPYNYDGDKQYIIENQSN